MTIPIIDVPLTPEQIAERAEWEAGQYQREVDAVNESRRIAYQLESDPLAFKYQETELPEDKQAWLDKKAEIKERYPEPEAPVK